MGRLEHHLHPVKLLVVKLRVDRLGVRKVLWRASSEKYNFVDLFDGCSSGWFIHIKHPLFFVDIIPS
jgi:hypothetical protein